MIRGAVLFVGLALASVVITPAASRPVTADTSARRLLGEVRLALITLKCILKRLETPGYRKTGFTKSTTAHAHPTPSLTFLPPPLQAYGGGAWNYLSSGDDWPGTCATGRRQSPIAVSTATATPASRDGYNFNFGTASGLAVVNTGHALQVTWTSLEGNNARIPARGMWGAADDAIVSLEPLQVHVHSTCEHVVDSFLCPLELHLVTRVDPDSDSAPAACRSEAAPCLAVFGVMYSFSNDPMDDKNGNKFLDTVVKHLPKDAAAGASNPLPTAATLDLGSLLPAKKDLAFYSGSLTTPPCTEGVAWHLFVSPLADLTAKQLFALQHVTANTPETTGCEPGRGNMPCIAVMAPSGARTTNRALQPTNGREVLLVA
jgi:carbonic anhydrase